eukprot:TRINITY_DN75376_c0_g1_i1.p1 TRINITY_DN75376_c0_g1~~TRINITY_DN75376_c0_g1_i1.p1  ORF type:complete len:652 (+),score=113.89 TRINITY_DN75376_c0_g1_i1:166-2121(+)
MGAAQCGLCMGETELKDGDIAGMKNAMDAGLLVPEDLLRSSKDDKGYNAMRVSTTFTWHENSVDDLAWVNQGLTHLWPQLDELARFILENRVLPVLKDRLLSNPKAKDKVTDLRLQDFTIGRAPVVLGPIQSTPQRGSNVRVRCYMDYASDMRVNFEMDTVVGTIPFGIKDFRLSGPLVMHLRPFVATAPGTGGVSGGFIDMPKFTFQFSGIGQSVQSFPGFQDMVTGVCEKVLAEMIVLPNLGSQMMSFDELKMYPLSFHQVVPVGTLQVKILEIKVRDQKRHHHHHHDQAQATTADVVPEAKKKLTKFSLLASLFSVGKRIKKVAEEAAEIIDDGLARLAGHNTASYLILRVGQSDWTVELDGEGQEHEFFVYDHEQHLNISFWDRDFSSADDKMAEAEPLSMKKALEQSGQVIQVRGLHEGYEDESCEIRIQSSYSTLRPSHFSDLAKDRVMIVCRIREVVQRGSFNLKGKTLIVRMKCGAEEKTSKLAKYMKGVDDNPAAIPVLDQIRANMKEQGHSESAIEKALSLMPIAETRYSLNSSYFFVVPSSELESGTLQITLIEKVPQKQDKKKFDEVVIGTSAIELSRVRNAKSFLLPGPIEIDGGALGKIEIQIFLQLNGFKSEKEVGSETCMDDADDPGLTGIGAAQ